MTERTSSKSLGMRVRETEGTVATKVRCNLWRCSSITLSGMALEELGSSEERRMTESNASMQYHANASPCEGVLSDSPELVPKAPALRTSAAYAMHNCVVFSAPSLEF